MEALTQTMAVCESWEGTPSQLLEDLEQQVPELRLNVAGVSWPTTAP